VAVRPPGSDSPPPGDEPESSDGSHREPGPAQRGHAEPGQNAPTSGHEPSPESPTTPLRPALPGTPPYSGQRPYGPGRGQSPPYGPGQGQSPPYGPQPPYPMPPAGGPPGAARPLPFGGPPPPGNRPPPGAGWGPAWGASAQPPRRRGRSVLVPVAVVSLLLGITGGLVGGSLVDRGGTPNDTAPTPQPVITSSGPVAGGAGASPVIGVAEKVLPSVVSIDVQSATSEVAGSGFVYDHRGHIVTNNHVVEGAGTGGEIRVLLPDGSQQKATVVGRSPSYDIAVIQVAQTSKLVPATLGSSDRVRVGQSVVAIGSPLGLTSTVTSGIISATHRPVTAGGVGETSFINALQTDAAINPGNSGGPLVDLDGFVIGVNSAIATLGGSATQQSGSIGVGFSIPIDQVSRTVEQILASGHAEYPVIGARVSLDRSFGGARVTEVDGNSPAAAAGIQTGDLIEKIDGDTVHNGVELIVGIRTYRPGDTVTLTVLHGGNLERVPVVLGHKVG
jgi:putative serine protease PepD